MSAFGVAWDTWLFYSVLGFVFCLLTMKWSSIPTGIYFLGGLIYVFAKISKASVFGVSEAEWKNSEYWKEVRIYLIGGQLFLSVLLGVIHEIAFKKKSKSETEQETSKPLILEETSSVNSSQVTDSSKVNTEIKDDSEHQSVKSYSGSNWYLAESKSKRLRQIVFEISEDMIQETKLGSLILAAKYNNLMEKGWATGFFRLDGDRGPFLLVRADEFSEEIRKSKIKLGISFFRMDVGGLFGIYVHVDSEKLRKVRDNPNVYFEIAYGLDESGSVDLMTDFLSKDKLELILADKNDRSSYNIIDTSGGGFKSSVTPLCKYDITISLDENSKKLLNDELNELKKYHSSIPSGRRNFQTSVQQLWNVMPEMDNPILDK